MTSLAQAWSDLRPALKIVNPVPFTAEQWSLIERLRANFNDREAQTRLPLPIARFRETARRAIHDDAKRFDDVETADIDTDASDGMASYARQYSDDVDAMMRVLVPSARFRKGHYAYGKFTVPQPHGLHTDHSQEDPDAAGEPICIARIETLGTHYLTGDYRAYDARTRSMLNALRYWTPAPEGQPEAIFEALLKQGTLRTMPVNHVVLMVAGNSSERAQATQHIAARPPEGGQHSAFFQRQYRLVTPDGAR
jgi:hypothetical protein